MNLSGQQRKQLQNALVNAFPTKPLLERMLSYELDKHLDEFAGGNDLQEIVFNLIKKAEAEGWIEELIRAALKSNSGNSSLKAIAEELIGPVEVPLQQREEQKQLLDVKEKGFCPYKGLSYFDFTEQDAQYFFGRKTLTAQLLEKVRTSNFLAVLGASGSGKSSVVRAGLLYQLKLGQELSGSNSWQIRIFRPRENPLQNLALAFVEQGLSDIDSATQLAKAEELIASGDGLRQLISVAKTPRVVLVIDQFEEIFTLCKDTKERQQFFECLLGTLENTNDKLCLVLVMRADFFGKCAEQEYAGLAKKIEGNLVTVTPMNRDELRQVIIEPALKVGLKVESELVDEMIADVENSPGSLPLLQYTLTELWKLQTEEKLTLASYTRVGRVSRTLQQRATKVYESLSPEEQQAAKRVFLELTQLGEGTEDTRRQVLQRDLVTEKYSEVLINKVIQKLADEKLIVTGTLITKKSESSLERVAVVDVAHEALIRHWSLLRKLVEESRDMLQQKRKIEAAAIEWRDNGKLKDYLLLGKQLNQAIAFQKEQATNLELSDLARDFIWKSIKHRQNKRYIVIGFCFIPFVVLAVFLRNIVEEPIEQIKIKQYLHTIEAPQGQIENSVRIEALQKLVKVGTPLNNIRLDRVDFRNVNLRGVNFRNANLKNRNLIDANLRGANFEGANLIGANLRGANFEGANLKDANLSGANFERANLRNANLRNANFESANLRNANSESANLRGANLSGAKFVYTNLNGADLISATLIGSNLIGSNLRGADLRIADLRIANLRGANLGGANLGGANLRGANLGSANLIGSNLIGSNLIGSNLDGADLRDANLRDANLGGANFMFAQNLISEQVKFANNWQYAQYGKELRTKLGLQNLQNRCNCVTSP